MRKFESEMKKIRKSNHPYEMCTTGVCLCAVLRETEIVFVTIEWQNRLTAHIAWSAHCLHTFHMISPFKQFHITKSHAL